MTSADSDQANFPSSTYYLLKEAIPIIGSPDKQRYISQTNKQLAVFQKPTSCFNLSLS